MAAVSLFKFAMLPADPAALAIEMVDPTGIGPGFAIGRVNVIVGVVVNASINIVPKLARAPTGHAKGSVKVNPVELGAGLPAITSGINAILYADAPPLNVAANVDPLFGLRTTNLPEVKKFAEYPVPTTASVSPPAPTVRLVTVLVFVEAAGEALNAVAEVLINETADDVDIIAEATS